MDRERFLNDVKSYADEVIYYMDQLNNVGKSNGEVSYNIDQLKVVYKMNRMLSLNYISKEQYDRLMNLYYDYLRLNKEYDYLSYCLNEGLENESSFEINEKVEQDLYDQIEETEMELRRYELLEEYLEFNYLIDTQIRVLFKKNK